MSKITDVINDIRQIDVNTQSITDVQNSVSNVNNISDLDKPISTATQTALDSKSDTTHNHSGTYLEDFTETVYTLTGTDINASNGTIQTLDATSSPTLTSSLTTGQSIELIITWNSGTVTFPTATWWGGEPSAFGTVDSIEVKNVGGTLYLRHIGTIA